MNKRINIGGFFTKVFPELNKAIDAIIYVYMGFVFVVSMNLDSDIKKYSNAFALVVMAFIGIYVLIHNFDGIINRFTVMFGAYTAYCLLTILWSADKAISIERATTVLKLFIVCALIYYYITNEKKTDMLLHAIYIGGLSLLAFTLVFYGPKDYISGMLSGKRMGYDFADANDLGMALMYTSVTSLYYTFYEKRWWNIFFSAACAFVAVGTGSRIAILIFVVGLFCLFLFFQTGEKRIVCLLGFVALAAIGYAILHLPVFSGMLNRLNAMFSHIFGGGGYDSSTNTRIEMARAGIEQFKRTPIFGFGIGSSNIILLNSLGYESYLHNNYIELLACAGIVGFVLFYGMHVFIISKTIKNAFRRNNSAVIVISLIAMSLFQEITNVDYYEKIPLILLMFMFCTVEQLKNNTDMEN